MTDRRRILRWVGRIAIVLLFAPLVLIIAGFLLPWSRINCWDEEIDLQSGRVRTTWYLCFLPVSVQINESAFSRVLTHEDTDGATPNWQRVNTFSPGVHYSPHYRFHGATTEVSMVEDSWQAGRFTLEARRASAKRILESLREHESLWSSRDYRQAIAEIGFKNYEANRETTLDELPQ